MRILLVLLTIGAVGFSPFVSLAQEGAAEETVQQSTSVDAEDFEKRLDIAKELHKIRPVRDQVDDAVDQVSKQLPEMQREAFKSSMRNILNYNSIRNISVNAMAETFTLEELESMLKYNKKPEAQSANKKFPDYQDKVSPEIVRMIDKAIMRMRTGVEE